MFNKKRYWLFALVLVFMLAIVGCSKDDDTSTEPADTNDNASGNTDANADEEVEELVTFKFFNAHKPYTDINTADTTIGKMLEEATGVNFDIEHIDRKSVV